MNKILRAMALASSTMLFASLVSACGSDDGGTAGTDGLTTIRVVSIPASTSSVMSKIAQDSGMAEKNGIELELVQFQAAPPAASALVSGGVDIATLPTTIVLSLLDQKTPISVIGGYAARNDWELWATKDDVQDSAATFPDNLRQLKGKRIGVSAIGGITQQVVEAALTEAGMSPEDVTFIATGTAVTGTAALKNDKVDALVGTPAAVVTLAQADVDAVQIFSATDPAKAGTEAGAGLGVVSTTSASFQKENPQAVTAYCATMRDSLAWAQDPANADAVAKTLGEWLSITPEQAAEVWAVAEKAYLGDVTAEDWDAAPNWLTGGKPVPAFDSVVNNACA